MYGTIPQRHESSQLKDCMLTLAKNFYMASKLLGALGAFRDIPESWLDGGPSKERLERLECAFKDETLAVALKASIEGYGALAAELGMDGLSRGIFMRLRGEMKTSDTESVSLKVNINKFVELAGNGVDSLKDLSQELNDFASHAGKPDFMDKALDELGALLDRTVVPVHSLYYASRYILIMLYGGRLEMPLNDARMERLLRA